ncbi:MAG: MFS transporter [Gammaproteobacteria bacterium]|nr:MFS transporter [Gammaproteobacteria bacterium]
MSQSTLNNGAIQRRSQLSHQQLAAYGVGSVASAMFNTVPALVLLFFMTQTLGVSPAWAGAAMLLPKLWDVITDPLMGYISDRTQSRWGRRRPWMLLGAFTMPLAFSMVFSVPDYDTWQSRFAWVMGWYMLAATCFTVYVVPYVSMPAEMTNNYHERTKILSWRMAFVVIGIMVGGGLAPLLIAEGGGGRDGHALMASVLGGVMFVVMLFTFFATANLPRREWQPSQSAGWQALKIALRNRPFKVLMLAYMLMMVGGNCLMATVPFYVAHILEREGELVTALFLCHLVPSLLSIPLWNRWSQRVGKHRGLMVGVAIYALGCAALFFTGDAPSVAVILVIITLMGTGMGAIQLYPFAMMPDVIALDRRQSGLNREGLFTGVWIANEKVGIASGAFLAALVLELFGFVEGGGTQAADALQGVQMAIGLAPALLLFLSMAILTAYSLDRELLRITKSKQALEPN